MERPRKATAVSIRVGGLLARRMRTRERARAGLSNPRRALLKLIRRQLAIAILIQTFQSGGRVCDFVRGQNPVVVAVQRGEQRRDKTRSRAQWASGGRVVRAAHPRRRARGAPARGAPRGGGGAPAGPRA